MRPMQGPSNATATAALRAPFEDGASALRPDQLLARSSLALGHGRYSDISDVVFVKRSAFSRVRASNAMVRDLMRR